MTLQENNGHGGYGNGAEGGHGGGGEEGGHGGGAVDGAEGNQEDEDDDNENGDDAISAIVAAAIRHAKLMMKNAWRAVVLTAGFRLAITLASFIRIIYLSFSTANNPMPRSLLRQRIARDWVAINVVDDDVWMDAFLDLFFALSLALAHFEEDQLWLDTEA
ncbi:unnamed protein product [Cuscuta campestris]|uniref:Uncharacterized protein n=2 Tax=Cuscuta sect. Cleistogrammica TaxID=1824901 RepID=A0A484MPH1_9ASTE|nr:hypothetical protein DM860_009718 [Cuscuta australis]VFQ89986.1 unnamed protein product [Cuscuta campestris]